MARRDSRIAEPDSPPLLFWGLTGLIALLPLPLGANRLWAWSAMAMIVGVLFLAWAVHLVRHGESLRIPWRRHAPATLLFMLAIGWFALQASGWTPAAWDHPLWSAAATALDDGAGIDGAISLDPAASLDVTMRFLAYGVIFWLALHMSRGRDRALQALWVIVVAGTLYAVYGLIVKFSGSNTILWFDKWAYENVVTSTFVNRNNYATYGGLVILTSLCLLTRYADEAAAMGVANRTGWVYMLENMGAQVYILLAALFVQATALLLTGSRGGLLATAIGVMVFLAALTIYKRRRIRRTIVYVGLIAAAGLALLSFSGGELASRLNEAQQDLAGRGKVWTLTREAIAERPMLGTGLGTFADVYLQIRDERLPAHSQPFVRAHNGYLELILEGGFIGAALLFGALAWLGLWCLYGAVVRRNDGVYPCLGLGAFALVGSHAWVDFSLQIPAVAATFALIVGVACAQANSHR